MRILKSGARSLRNARLVRLRRYVFILLLARAAHTLYRRHWRQRVPRALSEPRPFLAFTGSGLLLAYYHGMVTYIRDHFYVDNLRLSAISGGCSTILALAMGIDLYQILLLGLHLKQWTLKEGLYLNSFSKMVDEVCRRFREIGVTDQDVKLLSARQQCFIGVTQCFPPRHRCMPVPTTVKEMTQLWLSSMCILPFFSTPGVYRGKYYVDGCFSAIWSLPDDQAWSDVIKMTCMPSWAVMLPPAMAMADVQPSRFMPTEVVVLYPWSHQRELIKRGYFDTKAMHSHLVSRGLRQLPNAPLTTWATWDALFASVDESKLPPLSTKRSTPQKSPLESHHDEILKTHSASDLRQLLKGPRERRLSNGGSKSDVNIVGSDCYAKMLTA